MEVRTGCKVLSRGTASYIYWHFGPSLLPLSNVYEPLFRGLPRIVSACNTSLQLVYGPVHLLCSWRSDMPATVIQFRAPAVELRIRYLQLLYSPMHLLWSWGSDACNCYTAPCTCCGAEDQMPATVIQPREPAVELKIRCLQLLYSPVHLLCSWGSDACKQLVSD